MHTDTGDKTIQIRSQMLTLMKEKTLFWHERKTLLAADVHIGKDTTFRKSGIAAPETISERDLLKLSTSIARTKAKRLVLLGDFIHSKLGCSDKIVQRVSDWKASLSHVEVILILGNHDSASGGAPPQWEFKIFTRSFVDKPFSFTHHPVSSKNVFTFSGHLHPAVRLFGKARQTEKLPCFYFEENLAVLPAFGSFTGTSIVQPREGAKVYVVANDTIIEQ